MERIARDERYIWIGSTIVIIIAWFWSFTNNFVLTYNDGASHLNIARRVVDNLTPGIAQIGTVWLPLPHILMLITAQNYFMWQTALACIIVSMVSYLIIISLVSHNAFVARAKLPMKYYVHEGTREYWHNALKKPAAIVKDITTISCPPDSVFRSLKNNPDFIRNYVRIHQYNTIEIYKHK